MFNLLYGSGTSPVKSSSKQKLLLLSQGKEQQLNCSALVTLALTAKM